MGQRQGKDSAVGPTPKFEKWVVGTESGLCLWHTSSAPQPSGASPSLGGGVQAYSTLRKAGVLMTELPCLVLKSSCLRFVCLSPYSFFLPFAFGVSCDLCMKLIKGSTSFSILNHPLKDAGVAPPTPSAWARGSVGGSSESGAVGVRVRHTHSTSLSSFQRQRLPRGAPVPGMGGGARSHPLWVLGLESWPHRVSSLLTLVRVRSTCRPPKDGMAGGKKHSQISMDAHGQSLDPHAQAWAPLCRIRSPPGSLAYLPGRHWEGWP